ncbi:hypothetical protein L7F22_061461 [Adiantum nelumboides]|nr:hypothetical protein [Adiantum nelumboides]
MPIGKRTTQDKEGRNAPGPSKKKGKSHEDKNVKAKRKRRARHKFHVSDFPLGDGQLSYDLKEDLTSKKADVTFGQLIEMSLEVEAYDAKAVVNFHVMQVGLGAYPIILGRPWLRAVGAAQDWRRGTISLYGKTGVKKLYNMDTRKILEEPYEDENESSDEDYSTVFDEDSDSTTSSDEDVDVAFLLMDKEIHQSRLVAFANEIEDESEGPYEVIEDEGFTESSKLRHVAMHFQKSVKQWWASLRANGEAPQTWKNLRASIIKQFLSNNAKDKVLTEWRSLKLTPFESIHKYVDKFWDLHLKAIAYKKIDFEEQKQQFCAGLPKDMNEYVNSQRPNTIFAVIHHTMVAARINFQQGDKRNLKPMETKEKHEPKGKHHPQSSSKGNSSNNKAKEKGVYKGKNRLTPKELERYRKDNRCFKCGDQGHLYQTCPQRNALNEQPRASIIEAPKEDVHGKGSPLSYAWGKLATKLGIQDFEMGDAIKADVAFIGRDASVTPLIGKLRLHIQGYVDKEDFFISPLKHEDVILGVPWFDRLAASIKFRERKISFQFREKDMYIVAQESDVFIDDILEELPPKQDDDDHAIELIPGSSPPNKPLYRVPQAQQEEIMRQVNELFGKGMERPSSSPFCSPILLVHKKDGTYWAVEGSFDGVFLSLGGFLVAAGVGSFEEFSCFWPVLKVEGSCFLAQQQKDSWS